MAEASDVKASLPEAEKNKTAFSMSCEFVTCKMDCTVKELIQLLAQRTTMAALRHLRQISQEVSQPGVTGWGRRPAALRSLSQRLSKGFNEAVNGFTDDGWSMLESDGIDDVTILVNSSPSQMMGINIGYNNSGFPSVTSSVLCAKASMLLQNVPPAVFLLYRFMMMK